MLIRFNTYLDHVGIDPANVRLVRHRDTRKGNLAACFDLWMADDGRFERYQNNQRKEQFPIGGYLASFVVTPQRDTLFVGLYEVLGVERDVAEVDDPIAGRESGISVYDTRLSEHLAAYRGKLVIDWGAGKLAWVQRGDRQNKPVIEVRRKFREDPFPGFRNLVVNFGTLEAMPENWKDSLRSVSGVYLLVCNRTGKQYVGSAYGAEGIWGRWSEYLRNGHGGNVQLKAIDFWDCTACVLEILDPGVEFKVMLATETMWKKKLQSREFGFNSN